MSSTNLAITGDGFSGETEEGVRYTRSGNFSVDGNGYLVSADGHYVLGTEGRINIGTTEFDVLANGVINVDGRNVGRLRIETFEDEACFAKRVITFIMPSVEPLLSLQTELLCVRVC